MTGGRFSYYWRTLFTRFSGPHGMGKLASRLAAWGTIPYQGRAFLADFSSNGYVAPTAGFGHTNIRLGKNVYVGDRVYAFEHGSGGMVELSDRVHLYGETIIHSGDGATLRIGYGTHIQPGCFLAASLSDISIGRNVEIAPCCAFYSSNHGVAPGQLIMEQGLTSKGPIIIGDGAWLGHGVTVLAGVRIGEGAVVGSGSVVVRDIPDNAIAAGIPAAVIKHRDEVPV